MTLSATHLILPDGRKVRPDQKTELIAGINRKRRDIFKYLANGNSIEGFALYREETSRADPAYYDYEHETFTDENGVHVRRYANPTPKAGVEALRAKAIDDAESEVLELINDAIASETTFTRAGKGIWAAKMTNYIENLLLGAGGAWAGTIRPAFVAAQTYQDLIDYIKIWRDDLPPWPENVPKPK